ncbi:MAG: amidase [Roseovarius sp.]|nr:amidase [Roseovarius sp.]
MEEILEFDAARQAEMISAGEVSAEEIMSATLDRIDRVNGPLNAIVSIRDHGLLLEEARNRDNVKSDGPLHGLPIAIKDLANAKGFPTSMGSTLFKDFAAQDDSVHVARLKAAGAIVIGKTNTPEFGLGSHTFNSVHGSTCNPYCNKVSCGGSSGGAAVALAARMVSIADGSDMMGSLRNPAGWNNVYGMRPSWGLVPSDPEGDTFLHQLATNGPMARSPGDLGLLLRVMSGPDSRQPHGRAFEPVKKTENFIKGRRIGWLADWGGAHAYEDGIMQVGESAMGVFESLGAAVEALQPPFGSEELWNSWTTLRSWQIASRLAVLLDDPEKRNHLKRDAIWEIERGIGFTAMDVHSASVIRSSWFRSASLVFDVYDALVLPSAQVWPFPIESISPETIGDKAMDTYHRWMEVTIPASLIGLPVVAIPAGFGDNGLPAGIQLIGRRGSDAALLEMAKAYHVATQWPEKRPPGLQS